MLAADGSKASGVILQSRRVPPDATHLVVSVGGNNALGHLGMLADSAQTVAEVLQRFSIIRTEYKGTYLNMLNSILEHQLPIALCTIDYPSYPEENFQNLAITTLSKFNDCIIRAGISAVCPLLDLRLICDARADYANPIEPSAARGSQDC